MSLLLRAWAAVTIAAGLALTVFLAPHTRTQPVSPPRPNIVLVIADDWSFPHAGIYGDSIAPTPHFDRVGREGIFFANAFTPAPSCSPARASILTGQYPHRLNEGANLAPRLSRSWPVYTELLERSGYVVGLVGKGCAPASFEGTRWPHDPAGSRYAALDSFLHDAPEGKPFCVWMGSRHPHRPYIRDSGLDLHVSIMDVDVPPTLPATTAVRRDLLDYYAAVQEFDEEVGRILTLLDERGLADNTLLVVTSDNGMPFPRAKANCYDAGVRVPLAIRWPAHIEPGRRTEAFVNLSDLAPTFLEVADLDVPSQMTGQSIVDVLEGSGEGKGRVFIERERHALGRGGFGGEEGRLSYPIRAVRTPDFLYILNLRPELWPAGDPPLFRDIDVSPSLDDVVRLERHADNNYGRCYRLACAPRPREELYDIRFDPYQITNLAGDPEYREVRRSLHADLARWMRDTGDPRADGDDDRWDHFEFVTH